MNFSQNIVALSYHKARWIYFVAVMFAATIIMSTPISSILTAGADNILFLMLRSDFWDKKCFMFIL